MKKVIGIKIYAQDTYKKSEEADLVFEIINLTDKIVHVLKWNTPLEGMKSPCLEVKKGNKLIEYDGILIKRGSPREQDFYTLAPNESISNKFDLTEAYDISSPGEVKVDFDTDKFVYYIDEPLSKAVESSSRGFRKSKSEVSMDMKPVTFKISSGTSKRLTSGQLQRKEEQQQKKKTSKASKDGVLMPCKIVSGTADQQAIAKSAHTNGYALTKAALSGLANDSKYVLWFGAHSVTRYAKVKSNYQTVINKMESTEFTYNLSGDGCGSGVYAYTYKGTTTIWFCDAFWAAPDTGTDSRAGTVLHEHTHASASIDDIQYGQTGCKELAKNDPDKAINNADSHEYYAGG